MLMCKKFYKFDQTCIISSKGTRQERRQDDQTPFSVTN